MFPIDNGYIQFQIGCEFISVLIEAFWESYTVQLISWIELLVTVTALAKLGAVSVMTNPTLSGKMFSFYIENSNANAFVIGEEYYHNVSYLLSNKMRSFYVSKEKKILIGNDLIDIEKKIKSPLDTEPSPLDISLTSAAICVPPPEPQGKSQRMRK